MTAYRGPALIPIRAVIEDHQTGDRLRVVHIHAASGTASLYAIGGKEWPFVTTLQDLERGFHDGRYQFIHETRPFKPHDGA